MSLVVVVVVLAAGLVHAVWNALVKSIPSQATSFAFVNLGVALTCWTAVPFVGLPRAQAWPYLIGSVGCHIGYELFLMGSYQRSDFARAYPIARGTAPLLVSLGGLVFASEHVSLAGVGGILLVVIGVMSLSYVKHSTKLDRTGAYWALTTGVAIAVYTVVDGLGVRASHNTLRYAATLFVIQSTLWILAVALRRGWRFSASRSTVVTGVAAGVLSMVAYTAVLYAQTRASLGIVSALRETGVVWAAMIGIVVFKEGRARTLLTPALLVGAGIALMS